MDQRIVAGFSNVYKSEPTSCAGIDPWRAVGSSAPREAQRLGATAASLMAEEVREGGPSAPTGPRRPAVSRERTWVYARAAGRAGAAAPPIRSRGQGDAQPHTCWCPACRAECRVSSASLGEHWRTAGPHDLHFSLTSAPARGATQVRKRKIR